MDFLKLSAIPLSIFFIILAFFMVVGLHIETTSDGQHTGYVTAVETNGLIFKTNSVYFKTGTESSQEDRYCVVDDLVKQELIKSQKDKKLVTIKYIDYLSTGWTYCKGSDIAIITGVN